MRHAGLTLLSCFNANVCLLTYLATMHTLIHTYAIPSKQLLSFNACDGRRLQWLTNKIPACILPVRRVQAVVQRSAGWLVEFFFFHRVCDPLRYSAAACRLSGWWPGGRGVHQLSGGRRDWECIQSVQSSVEWIICKVIFADC